MEHEIFATLQVGPPNGAHELRAGGTQAASADGGVAGAQGDNVLPEQSGQERTHKETGEESEKED